MVELYVKNVIKKQKIMGVNLEKVIMNEDKIRQLIDQIDPEGNISQEKIEMLISAIKEREDHPFKDGEVVNGLTFNTLKEQIENEPNWRKRAILAAKMISLNLTS